MKNPKNYKLFLLITAISVLLSATSCVSMEKYNELATRCGEETLMLNNKITEMRDGFNEMSATNQKLVKDNAKLKADTADLLQKYRNLNAEFKELERNYENLRAQYNLNYYDNEKAMGELRRTQDELLMRETRLNNLEKELAKKSRDIDELEAALRAQDSITNALRKSVADALMGFQDKGLSVYTKKGKVYVSLEEKLLFASGKWEVSKQGVSALKNLAMVLEKDTNINVLIEGHTDNVPLKSSNQVEDNWDLSVMRATSIVKILLSSAEINPTRVVASGRGEYLPVMPNTTAENKAKNRRTEIILTPKLEKLLEIIGE